MKIRFMGVGSAFTTPDYYQSNMLITARSGKRMLFDCGSDARHYLRRAGFHDSQISREIEAIYVSHLHSDHIGGLEWLAIVTYFNPGDRPHLYCERKLMKELWENSLRGGLEVSEGKLMHLSDYFVCHPVEEKAGFEWEDIRFELVKLEHITGFYKNMYSYGLILTDLESGKRAYISSDVKFRPQLIAEIAGQVDVIFHDSETTVVPTGVHTHYSELVTLPPEVKAKMWLYHYQPHPKQQPDQDGFAGFAARDQEFDLE